MLRFVRPLVGVLLILAAVSLLSGKAWLSFTGPYLESLELYSYCQAAQEALAAGETGDALELADSDRCPGFEAPRANWLQVAWQGAGDCASGIWTGRGDGVAGIGCAVASDLFVVGDVRDLARQGIAWGTGGETDPVLAALSAAGLALTVAPIVDAGNSLFKSARRLGSLSDELGRTVVDLAARRAWRPLANLLGDAGRIARRLGPVDANRALAHADDAEELARLARFVETVDEPTLALRLGGKNVARISDDVLYREALLRGPSGLALAAQRGSEALLARKPLVLFVAKTVYKQPEMIADLAGRIATWLLGLVDWRHLVPVSLILFLVGLLMLPRRKRTGRRFRALTR